MEKIRIALQKKGRLHDDSMKLLKEAGIKFNIGSGKLVAQSPNFPIEVLFLRDDDIPQTIADKVADIGVVGENEVEEKDFKIAIAKRLGFSKCRISLAIPKADEYNGLEYFQNKKVATSYPVILKKYFDKMNVNAEIHEIAGSVEIAPGIGLADGIFDIVSSGSTLVANRLKEVEVVMKSEALLVKADDLSAEKQALLDELLFRINSVMTASSNKYILLNAPNNKVDEIAEILPGMKSPTVLPLAEEGWSSIHSVISEKQFWENIGKLKECGAQGIITFPIEKMIL
ncbi:ATP phosphoribosyltransferase [Labilibacter sediminis]|nr:ATP phosphoribosyltransferase [Labilibacter sediminis]